MSIRLEYDGQVAHLVVDRPRAKNALDRRTMRMLEEAIQRLETDTELRAVIMYGGGDGVLSGGDVVDLNEIPTEADGRKMARHMGPLLGRLRDLPVPVLAALPANVYGGGCELVLAADIRIAAPTAKLIFRQIALGLTPGWGGGQRLAELVGQGRALMLLASGASVAADEAERLALVDLVDEAPVERARALCAQISGFDAASVQAVKSVVRLAGKPLDAGEALRQEAEIFGRRWGEQAHQKAVAAFLAEKAGKL